MKIVVKAKEDVYQHYGSVHLEAKAGENLTLSPADAEVALHTGNFEFVKELSESEAETARLDTQKTEADLKREELKADNSQEKLFEMAKGIEGAKKSMTKDELIDLILAPRAPVVATPEKDKTGE
jgi:hypothetical protein